MRRRIVRALLTAAVAAAAGSSCADILGVSGFHIAPKDAGSGHDGTDAKYASPSCGPCIASNCATEQANCERDSDCAGYAACGFACPLTDGACQFACLQRLKARNQSADTLVACEFKACTADCVSCGAPFSGITPDCATCAIDDTVANGLCALTASCLREPRCNAYVACLAAQCLKLGTTDPECRLICGGQYPVEARAYYQGVGSRYFGACRDKCSAGKNWDCVQPAVWPPVEGKTARVTLTAGSPAPDASAAPVRVRVCPGTDYFCAAPIDDRETDPNGGVTFELAQNSSPGNYYYEVYQPLAGIAEPYMIYIPWLPTVGDITLGFPGAPFSLATLDADVASRGDRPRDGVDDGIVTVLVGDCVGGWADLGSLAPEVTVAASSGGDAYYGFPPNILLAAGGQASFINVPPGSASIAVKHDGASIATAVVPVRAGILTYVTFNSPEGL